MLNYRLSWECRSQLLKSGAIGHPVAISHAAAANKTRSPSPIWLSAMGAGIVKDKLVAIIIAINGITFDNFAINSLDNFALFFHAPSLF